ncbi:MAG: FkbM family methyltransferase [Paracoccaceae bacterium]
MANRLIYHMPRVRHQLGELMRIGSQGYRVRGYLANRQATTLGHEPHLLKVLSRAMAARTGPVLDVGVNTGQTLLKVLSIDPSRPYIGFEPQVGCCFCLGQFLEDNNLSQAQIVPVALSDRDGMIQLHGAGAFDEMASTRPRPGTQAHWVAARIGDHVLAELGVPQPGVIKIDVEGAELEVLSGMRDTLARAHPVVFFEVLPNFKGDDRVPLPPTTCAHNNARAAQILSFFEQLGYRLQQIAKDGTCRSIKAFSLDDRAGFTSRDYVAWPPLDAPATTQANQGSAMNVSLVAREA